MSEYGEFIKRQLEEINLYSDFDEDTDLIESEILDSLAIVFLVMQLENEYNVTIDENLVIPENFRCIRSIEKLLNKMLQERKE